MFGKPLGSPGRLSFARPLHYTWTDRVHKQVSARIVDGMADPIEAADRG